jgi:hypothetical protein
MPLYVFPAGAAAPVFGSALVTVIKLNAPSAKTTVETTYLFFIDLSFLKMCFY